MPDSSIDRSVTLPEVPEGQNVVLTTYLRNLNDHIAAFYDNLCERINLTIVEVNWGSDTPNQITSDQNDYSLAQSVVHKLSSDAPRTITGFAAPLIERMDILLNVGTQNIVVAHQNVGSVASNRVITKTGLDFTVAPNTSVMLWFDLTRWRQIS